MTVNGADTLRVTARMLHAGGDVQNVYHVKYIGIPSKTDQDVLDDMAAYMNACHLLVNDWVTDALDYDSIEVYDLTSGNEHLLGEVDWTTLTSGGSAAAQQPPQNALLALFNTGTLKSQGRKFLGPIGVNGLSADGTPTATVLTDLAEYIARVLQGHPTALPVYIPGNWRTVLEVFVPFATGIAKDFYATQRRRYLGSGS